MLELWQAEWCPHSHKVRQRLTELGLDFVAHQVAADKDDRPDSMEIPRLLTEQREVLSGEEQILPWLDKHFDDRDDAPRHRARARAEVKDFAELKS